MLRQFKKTAFTRIKPCGHAHVFFFAQESEVESWELYSNIEKSYSKSIFSVIIGLGGERLNTEKNISSLCFNYVVTVLIFMCIGLQKNVYIPYFKDIWTAFVKENWKDVAKCLSVQKTHTFYV